ncbi:MAG: aminopeptidase P family protein [Bacteroidaceae bacterium]|nr:aminopeptidase P family protein [Bacteroidaceae bacterium]
MKKDVINTRIHLLREFMTAHQLAAFIFPSTDPHTSEYPPKHWEGRAWISGFNGSAGTAVVTLDNAALWTDSRYFLSAAEQLKGTEFTLEKEKLTDTPSISQWLLQRLHNGDTVGLDGYSNTAASIEQLQADFHSANILLNTLFDPLETIWNDRPAIPTHQVFIQPLEYAGESCSQKVTRIRKKLKEYNAEGMLVSALDEVAWTLNLRGNDVHCNPVFVAYLLITRTEATLYINNEKLTPDVRKYLEKEQIKTADYYYIKDALKNYSEDRLLMDPICTNNTLFTSATCQIVRKPSPVAYLKAIKNEAEIKGYHRAMLRDGVAMVKFLRWLLPAVQEGKQTEISIDKKLTSLRAEQKNYKGISFDTIAGYQAHGAIVHYEANEETDVPLKPEGLLLLDSGAQYLDGTTDITRTIALGPITEKQKKDYTLVLKGHIQLALCKFPEGSSGTQLDILARNAMWKEGINYLHGTGHGVGSFLNVHEGPHQIRMNYMPAPLLNHMTVTNEPGIYKAGEYGCRTENTMIIIPYCKGEFGPFLQFEPLTLCPIDTIPIKMEMMSEEEILWINDYHHTVFEKLSPLLQKDEVEWLKEATQTITK